MENLELKAFLKYKCESKDIENYEKKIIEIFNKNPHYNVELVKSIVNNGYINIFTCIMNNEVFYTSLDMKSINKMLSSVIFKNRLIKDFDKLNELLKALINYINNSSNISNEVYNTFCYFLAKFYGNMNTDLCKTFYTLISKNYNINNYLLNCKNQLLINSVIPLILTLCNIQPDEFNYDKPVSTIKMILFNKLSENEEFINKIIFTHLHIQYHTVFLYKLLIINKLITPPANYVNDIKIENIINDLNEKINSNNLNETENENKKEENDDDIPIEYFDKSQSKNWADN